jgi:epoxide hydrolase A/B
MPTVADWERLPARQVATNGISLKVVEHGEGPLVVFCHGFPELGFSWRHQVFALADAGYRTLTPDLRGYGGSARPPAIEDYDILTLCADLVGLLDEDDAVFVGHDWGAALAWQLAQTHPDRVRAVAGLSVPVTPRSPAPPIPILRSRLGDDFYMVWFQEPGVADAVLARDVRRTLLSEDVLAGAWKVHDAPPPPLRPWQSEEELGVFVRAFTETGFTGGLNYYRNLDRNWALTEYLAGRTIDQPAMFLTGSEDLVGRFMSSAGLTSVLTDLRENVVIEGAGHWIQQERPGEVTAALLRFLGSLGLARTGEPGDVEVRHTRLMEDIGRAVRDGYPVGERAEPLPHIEPIRASPSVLVIARADEPHRQRDGDTDPGQQPEPAERAGLKLAARGHLSRAVSGVIPLRLPGHRQRPGKESSAWRRRVDDRGTDDCHRLRTGVRHRPVDGERCGPRGHVVLAGLRTERVGEAASERGHPGDRAGRLAVHAQRLISTGQGRADHDRDHRQHTKSP